MNDSQLRQDVIDELDFDPSIDASGIGVAVADGVVTLTGHVPAYVQKVDAERATWRVKGVKAIAQEIQVRLPAEARVNDDEIASRAVHTIAWHASIPRGQIHVKVANGWVTLSGEVPWHYQRQSAEASVKRLGGVKGVINAVTVAPTVSSADVRRHIADALRRHADVEADRIRIRIAPEGDVTLEGDVDDYDERLAVARAAWSVPGVHAVHDHMRIG
ncbi:BON domain-containing protein [Luteibacter sahnii]|uniref:BON domain-containing protein n=1 Tax=Luteibacter sahnii TaxID=3021977 RepID=UPI002A6B5CBB|nr:BON domain-containing protein [Luteibacter sp. PPL193]MDY1546948.1 BON domain-containing protein [Luteibacter sp. PPL193]